MYILCMRSYIWTAMYVMMASMMDFRFSEAQSMVASGHLTLAMRAIYHGGICTTDSSVLLVRHT